MIFGVLCNMLVCTAYFGVLIMFEPGSDWAVICVS